MFVGLRPRHGFVNQNRVLALAKLIERQLRQHQFDGKIGRANRKLERDQAIVMPLGDQHEAPIGIKSLRAEVIGDELGDVLEDVLGMQSRIVQNRVSLALY
jgi:hypothetical protein